MPRANRSADGAAGRDDCEAALGVRARKGERLYLGDVFVAVHYQVDTRFPEENVEGAKIHNRFEGLYLLLFPYRHKMVMQRHDPDQAGIDVVDQSSERGHLPIVDAWHVICANTAD